MSDADTSTRAWRVVGRVQGVGFRWFVLRRARRVGVTGWVRNDADGSVAVVAKGTAAQLQELESELQTGPPAARVDAADRCAPPGNTELPETFEIR